MKFKLDQYCDSVVIGNTAGAAVVLLQKEDARMVYYAMREYADSLNNTLKGARDEDFEDRAFIHDTLAKINRFLFEMLDDHDPREREAIREWLLL